MRLFTIVVVLCTLLGHIDCSPFAGQVVYQGCFSVLTLQRRIGHMLHPFVGDNCLTLCSGKGHNQAGLDSINFICYCGDDLISQISRAEDSQCKPCKDDSNLFCGGVLKISLYEIELNKITVNETVDNQDIKSQFSEEPLLILAGHKGIYSYNISTNDLRTVIDTDQQVEALDYNLRNGKGYAIWDGTLRWFPLIRKEPLVEYEAVHHFIAHVGRCPTFTLDWVHGIIFYPDCYAHRISWIDINLDHYTESSLVNVPEGAWATDMAVDPYKGLLFWTTGAMLWSCRLDGRGLKTIIPEFPVNRVSSLSIVTPVERVYFSGSDKHDKNTTKLYYTTYNGPISHPVQFQEYEGGSSISSFGIFYHISPHLVSSLSASHIYFIKHIDSNSSVVMASKIDFNHRPTIFLQGEHIQVNRLRLVHPSLQSPVKEDACTDRGCSHLCLMEASLPKCFCPRYHELDHDNKTCIINPGEEEEVPFLIKIIFGLMLVLMVLIGAGVLMCICDKIWSQLHPSVVILGVSNRSFVGHRRQDGENLI